MSAAQIAPGVDYGSETLQHVMATFVADGVMGNPYNPFFDMRGYESSPDTFSSWPIQTSNFPQSEGLRTKYIHEVTKQKMVAGDRRDINANQVDNYDKYGCDYLPGVWSPQYGYPIDGDFARVVLRIPEWRLIMHQMKQHAYSFFNELMIAVASGRVGRSDRMGWTCFTDGEAESDRDAAGADAIRKASPDFKEIQSTQPNANLREPTQIWNPSSSNFADTPVAHPSTLNSTHTLTYEFLTKCSQRLKELTNAQRSGLPWRTAKCSIPEDTDGEKYGQGVRMSSMAHTESTGCLMISHAVAQQIQNDDDWKTIQNELSAKIGTKTGMITGLIGDIAGMRIYEMDKLVKFNAGTSGTPVMAQRCLIMGAGAMMELLSPHVAPGDNLNYATGDQKEFFQRLMRTPTHVRTIIKRANMVGNGTMWWEAYYNVIAQQFDLRKNGVNFQGDGTASYSRGGRIVGVDVYIP